MRRERADALLVLSDVMFSGHGQRIADLATKSRLAAVYGHVRHAETGGLIVYAVNVFDLYGRTSIYVDKILKGVKPADLPVEQPTKYQLVINLKTAKALGLTIPPAVRRRKRSSIHENGPVCQPSLRPPVCLGRSGAAADLVALSTSHPFAHAERRMMSCWI